MPLPVVPAVEEAAMSNVKPDAADAPPVTTEGRAGSEDRGASGLGDTGAALAAEEKAGAEEWVAFSEEVVDFRGVVSSVGAAFPGTGEEDLAWPEDNADF